MKTLHVIRHAKSSWSFQLADFDRPLGKRGRRDVFKMGKHLAAHQAKPAFILTSPASRAFYTSLFLSDELGLDESQIIPVSKLYHASAQAMIKAIHEAPECSTLGLCGHNPGITSLVNQLAKYGLENLPTCGVIGIEFPFDSWKDVRFGSGAIRFEYFPKNL